MLNVYNLYPVPEGNVWSQGTGLEASKQPIIVLYFESENELKFYNLEAWTRGYKVFFMLNSAEHEIYPARKCQNVNNCWHFNIISMIDTTSERLLARNFFICRYFSFYEQLKF